MAKALALPLNDVLQQARISALTTPLAAYEMSNLDKEMSSILSRTDLPKDRKMKMYYDALNKFQDARSLVLNRSPQVPSVSASSTAGEKVIESSHPSSSHEHSQQQQQQQQARTSEIEREDGTASSTVPATPATVVQTSASPSAYYSAPSSDEFETPQGATAAAAAIVHGTSSQGTAQRKRKTTSPSSSEQAKRNLKFDSPSIEERRQGIEDTIFKKFVQGKSKDDLVTVSGTGKKTYVGKKQDVLNLLDFMLDPNAKADVPSLSVSSPEKVAKLRTAVLKTVTNKLTEQEKRNNVFPNLQRVLSPPSKVGSRAGKKTPQQTGTGIKILGRINFKKWNKSLSF